MFGLSYLLLLTSPCFCLGGRRIYRGYEAAIEHYPHAAFLHFDVTRPSSCCASLVASQALLTAAHCVDELSYERGGAIHVFFGHVIPNRATVTRSVVDFRVHPKYDETNGKSNLAVAFLNSRVPFSNKIKKVPLAFRTPLPKTLVFSAGWGRQNVKKIISNPALSLFRTMRVSKQMVIDRHRCSNMSGFKVGPFWLCTMPLLGHMHMDDSGNGVVSQQPVVQLLGVLSFVSKGINLYTDILSNKGWIRDSIYTLFRQYCDYSDSKKLSKPKLISK